MNVEMHTEVVIKGVCRCMWRPWLCKLGGHNRASVDKHLDAMIK